MTHTDISNHNDKEPQTTRGTEGTESTHVLVRNDVGDVLQDQLSPPAVLVKFLEQHPRLEIPSGERQTDVVTKTRKVFLAQGWQCRARGRVWLPPTSGNLMGIQPHLFKPMCMVCGCLDGTTAEGVARAEAVWPTEPCTAEFVRPRSVVRTATIS